MTAKTPTLKGRGMEKLAGHFHALSIQNTFHTQCLASRFALPIETAAIMAAFAFGGAHG